jgi:hypothetical protein
MDTQKNKLLLLGVGNLALAMHKQYKDFYKFIGTTRDTAKVFQFADRGIEPVLLPQKQTENNTLAVAEIAQEIIEPLANNANVLISFPPDGISDQILAKACQSAQSIIYISSTSVYGNYTGEVTENTPINPINGKDILRVKAEDAWLALGATVLRAPAIYGPNYGLHVRLKSGNYKLPGDGSNITSRIHVDDLTTIIQSIFKSSIKNRIYVVGDLCPASQIEVVTWLCQKLNIAIPSPIPIKEAPQTLQGNRSIIAKRVLDDLRLTLKYPTYKEGFSQCLSEKFSYNNQ